MEIQDRSTGLQLKQCDHHVHKACLQDIFRTKNECSLCQQKILLGYEKCLTTTKMAPNKVTKKKSTIDQKLKMAIIKEAEEEVTSFGVNGTRVLGQPLGQIEEEKESVVGRRDLFRLPEDLSQDIRIKKHQKRQAIVKQKSSLIAKLT